MTAATRRRRTNLDIWPGFVDALATLVMVFIFILMLFTLFQFHLKDVISGRDQALERLSLRVGELADQLAMERRSVADLRQQAELLGQELSTSLGIRDRLQTELGVAEGRLRDLTSSLDAVRERGRELEVLLGSERNRSRALQDQLTTSQSRARELQDLLAAAERGKREAETSLAAIDARAREQANRLAALEAARREGEARLTLSESQARTLAERLAAAEARMREVDGRLEDANKTIAADREKIEVQLRELDALRRNIQTLTILREQLERDLAQRIEEANRADQSAGEQRRLSSEAQFRIDMLTRQIDSLQQQLARLEAVLEASETKSREQNVQIVDLGRRLNLALASKVEELARYRSEFFGRLREALGDSGTLRIVGDRFVFPAEVLFESGSATLEPQGVEQIRRVAAALREIAPRIPPDLNWVLQVDGHTDKRPISRNFASNWELSQARALSVVRTLITEGIDPSRLSATGYAEFQPIDPRDDEQAYRRNRRIEIKLTDR
jgi:chemotaxis protein MotB